MNDTGGAGSVEGFGDLRCETHDFFDREHAIGSMLSKRLAFDQLHGDEADPVGLADLVNGRDPRMRDRGGSPRLAQEAVAAGFVSGNLGGEDLEGHRPLQALVPDAVDDAHASFAELGQDAEVREGPTFQRIGHGLVVRAGL